MATGTKTGGSESRGGSAGGGGSLGGDQRAVPVSKMRRQSVPVSMAIATSLENSASTQFQVCIEVVMTTITVHVGRRRMKVKYEGAQLMSR